MEDGEVLSLNSSESLLTNPAGHLWRDPKWTTLTLTLCAQGVETVGAEIRERFIELVTPHPTPYTLHLTPYTLHPTPHTLHLTPCTPHPTPYTVHPSPYTLHPLPYTLHRSFDHRVSPASTLCCMG